ncbi:YgiT-type zinc finger protein [Bradyrhizobium sp. USDA 10063]
MIEFPGKPAGELPASSKAGDSMSIDSNDSKFGYVCQNCNDQNIKAMDVRSAFFHRDRLVVVEDIPALVCANCGEQFYDDQTVVMLDLLRGEGFPAEKACECISVPVFSLRKCAVSGVSS